jgi:hypothetical protein
MMALLEMARDGLSSSLFDRVHDFLRGYASVGNPAVFRDVPNVQFASPKVDYSGTVIEESVRSERNPFGCSSADEDEPATVYASAAAEPSTSANAAAYTASASPPHSRPTPQLKFLIATGVLVAGVFASFKVPALCEPFGLCSSGRKNVKSKPRELKGAPSGTAQTVPSSSPPSALRGEGDAESVATPAAPSAAGPRLPQARVPAAPPRQSTTRPAYQPSYQPPQAIQSPAPSAPLREEPLW